jgi:CHASE2 domain-containing sensor protein
MISFSGTLKDYQTRLRKNWRTGAIGAGSAVFLGLLFLMSNTLGSGLRNLSYDLPYLLRLPFHSPEPIPEIAMVYMDDPSHAVLEQPWMQPWNRDVHAQLIDTLARANASAIVFDVLFDTPGTNDQSLIEAARKYGRVAMGAVFMPQIYAGEIIGRKASPPLEPLRNVVQWGVVEAADSDRFIRQHFKSDSVVPTLAWRVAEMTMPPPLPEPFGSRWLNYYGPPGALPYYSYADVLSNNVPAATFSNKVVFVGALYTVGFTGGKGTDDFRTPFTRWHGTKSPGVEINATTYLNLRRGDWLEELSPVKEFLLFLFTGTLLGFGLILFRPTTATILAILAFVTLTVVACLMVWHHRVWFPWMTIGCLQLPITLAWAILANTSRLYLEKETLEEQLATAQHRVVLGGAQAGGAPLERTAVVPEGAAIRKLGPPIPDHEMIRCIGSGAYGEVWLARDEIGSFHAVKIIFRKSFSDDGPFDREFRGLQQYTPISRTHQGLVHILHIGRNADRGYFFYIMEVGDCELNGQQIDPETYRAKNLARELDKRGHFKVHEVVDQAVELAGVLHYLHSKHLIHRDIKPSNIIFVNGRPKFADVGLVTHIAEKGRDVTYLGTEGFIAPEGPGTPGADVYSLGKVIYEATTGRSAALFPELPSTMPEANDSMALMQINRIILKACEADPKLRYQTAEQLQADLIALRDRLRAGTPG